MPGGGHTNRAGQRVPHESELQTTPDIWYLLRITPYRILNNTIEGATITFVDITERKRLEGHYYECDERLHAIVEQTIAGIAQVDVMGHYLFVNNQYCQFLGYTREELLRLSMQEMTDPDDLPYIMKLFQALVDGGGPDFHIERRYRRKDGSFLWVRNSVNGIRDRAGNLQSVVAVSIDITQSKLAEEKLQRNQARLRRSLILRVMALSQLIKVGLSAHSIRLRNVCSAIKRRKL